MDESQAIHALAALAQSTRLQAFRALVVAGPNGLTPGALAQSLQMPSATLSFHLKELLQAGLLSQERRGRHLVYRAEFSRMNALLTYLSEHCCQGQSCEVNALVCSN